MVSDQRRKGRVRENLVFELGQCRLVQRFDNLCGAPAKWFFKPLFPSTIWKVLSGRNAPVAVQSAFWTLTLLRGVGRRQISVKMLQARWKSVDVREVQTKPLV